MVSLKLKKYKNGDLIETLNTPPYTLKVEGLTAGTHNFYAKVFANTAFGITNAISVSVGDQVPYLGTPFAIPGTIDAGYYDVFEGGLGQNITYFDATLEIVVENMVNLDWMSMWMLFLKQKVLP